MIGGLFYLSFGGLRKTLVYQEFVSCFRPSSNGRITSCVLNDPHLRVRRVKIFILV